MMNCGHRGACVMALFCVAGGGKETGKGEQHKARVGAWRRATSSPNFESCVSNRASQHYSLTCRDIYIVSMFGDQLNSSANSLFSFYSFHYTLTSYI